MKSQTVEKVKEGLQTFQRIIKFHSTESASLVIKKAISEDPKILFYLKSYNIKGKQDEYEINVQYIHRDTNRTDVHVVSSRIVCEELICAFAGKYRNELIIITTSNYELRGLMDTFQEKYASFYPNLICIEGEKYRLNSDYYAFKFGYKYRIGYVKLAQMEMETEAEVKRIASTLFIPGIPVEAKIYLAHNYLASSIEYKASNENRLDKSYTQSAYGALVNKHCTCQGYAEAFKRLMDIAKIECFVIYGRTTGSSVLHAWNIVSLGKESSYYHVDVTWDSNEKKPEYTYFCKNDSFFAGKRNWSKLYNPKCEGSYPVLAIARRAVKYNRERLIKNGVDTIVLDC